MNQEEIKKEILTILNLIPISVSNVLVENSDGRIFLSIESSDSPLLIGSAGETLSALNHLFRRILERKGTIEENVVIDVNGYRKKIEERIRGAALMLGQRAVMFKHEVEMDPMGAYERRIVHSVFQNHPNIVTESQGEKNYRRVVLKYVENKITTQPEVNIL